LWKDGLARRLDITVLPDDEMAKLAAEMLGGPVDDATASRLATLSDGNPLAMRELVLGAVEAGALVEDAGKWRAPSGLPVSHRLSELVRERLGHLSDDERFALELVVLGEPLGPDLLGDVVGIDALTVLEQRKLVEVRPEGKRVEVWLSHPLHGEVVRGELPVLRRRKALRALADAVAAAGARRRGDVLRLATWRLELGDDGESELFLEAARQAYVALDLQRSMELAQAAWSAAQTIDAGYLLGTVRTQLSEHDAAEEVFAAVEHLAVDDRARVLVAVGRSENLFRTNRFDDAMEVITAAERSVVDPNWRDELEGHRATLVMLHGQAGEAGRIVAPLLQSEHGRTFVEAAIAGATVGAYDGRPLEALDLARRAFAVHLGIWDQELFQSDPAVHVFSELLALTQAGMLTEAEQLASNLYDMAVQAQRGLSMAALSLQLGLIATEQGRMRTALSWLQRCADLYDRHGPSQRRRFAVAGTVQVAAYLGDIAAGRAAEAELDLDAGSALGFTRPLELVARAWLEMADGHPTRAQELLEDAWELAMTCGERSSAAVALHAMARQGRAEVAAERAAALAPHVEGDMLTSRLAHVAALDARDADALADVAERFAAIGARLYAAEAMADASRARQRAGSSRDARLLAHHARSLAAECEGAATPSLAVGEEAVPLSKREREVALLAAQGLPTKEIAARLYLSPRTVENHLQRAYEKLGTSGRAELGIALGLVTD
jgi:DNA-binding CsgD family transcriptional regulator